MPKGYVIFTEDIHDQAELTAYVQQAIPTILQAGCLRSTAARVSRVF